MLRRGVGGGRNGRRCGRCRAAEEHRLPVEKGHGERLSGLGQLALVEEEHLVQVGRLQHQRLVVVVRRSRRRWRRRRW